MKVFVPKLRACRNIDALAITGAVRGISQIKLYKELGLESLRIRRWFRRLCIFFKIKIHGKSEYLFNKIPSSQIHYNNRNTDQVETSYCRKDIFKNSFFSLHNNLVE